MLKKLMTQTIYILFIVFFTGCSSKYIISESEFKESASNLFREKYKLRDFGSSGYGGSCYEYTAERDIYDKNLLNEITLSLKNYCISNNGDILSYSQLMDKYANGYTIEQLHNKNTSNICWTTIRNDRNYCVQNDKIIFSYYSNPNNYDNIFPVLYSSGSLIRQRVIVLDAEQGIIKNNLKNDLTNYDYLIKENKITINKDFDSIYPSQNKYYFSIVPKSVTYDSASKQVELGVNYSTSKKLSTRDYDGFFEMGSTVHTKLEHFTNKILSRLTTKYLINIRNGGNGNLIVTDKVYSDGTSRIRGMYNNFIKFHSADSFQDGSIYRYELILEMSMSMPIRHRKSINKYCSTLENYSYSQAMYFEKKFNENENEILKYKNADCTKLYIIEGLELDKIIIFDKEKNKTVYIAYINHF